MSANFPVGPTRCQIINFEIVPSSNPKLLINLTGLNMTIIFFVISIFAGYNPLVTPYSVKNKTESALKTLHQLLKSENVSLPNLDDGYRERKRKF